MLSFGYVISPSTCLPSSLNGVLSNSVDFSSTHDDPDDQFDIEFQVGALGTFTTTFEV